MTSYCVFNVGERRVGIALDHVREIIEPRLVVPTPIPLTPSFVHGLFNLRGQVLPYLDLSPFVGAKDTAPAPRPDERAVIVERGQLRFATTGRRIDTVEADPSTFAPLENAALLPALDGEASTDYGRFHVIHLDRLEACLTQSLKLAEPPTARADEPATERNGETATGSANEPATARNGEPATIAAETIAPTIVAPAETSATPAPSQSEVGSQKSEAGSPQPEVGSPTADLSPPTSGPSAPPQPSTRRERRERRSRPAQT